MAAFTVTVGGTLGPVGRIASEAPVEQQTTVAATGTDWDGTTSGKSEASVS